MKSNFSGQRTEHFFLCNNFSRFDVITFVNNKKFMIHHKSCCSGSMSMIFLSNASWWDFLLNFPICLFSFTAHTESALESFPRKRITQFTWNAFQSAHAARCFWDVYPTYTFTFKNSQPCQRQHRMLQVKVCALKTCFLFSFFLLVHEPEENGKAFHRPKMFNIVWSIKKAKGRKGQERKEIERAENFGAVQIFYGNILNELLLWEVSLIFMTTMWKLYLFDWLSVEKAMTTFKPITQVQELFDAMNPSSGQKNTNVPCSIMWINYFRMHF